MANSPRTLPALHNVEAERAQLASAREQADDPSQADG